MGDKERLSSLSQSSLPLGLVYTFGQAGFWQDWLTDHSLHSGVIRTGLGRGWSLLKCKTLGGIHIHHALSHIEQQVGVAAAKQIQPVAPPVRTSNRQKNAQHEEEHRAEQASIELEDGDQHEGTVI